jgi:hypothetical protein
VRSFIGQSEKSTIIKQLKLKLQCMLDVLVLEETLFIDFGLGANLLEK